MRPHLQARRRHHVHWLLLVGLVVGGSDLVLQLTVPQMQRGPAAVGSLAAAVGCLIFVVMDADRRTAGPRPSHASLSLRLAAAAARTGRSPRWIARVFRLPVAFAELLAAEACEPRHHPRG
ncbi:MAG: hypothetical protein QOF39_1241 [Frankiales bacterium]|jgi:hypothetical protein|nr:hypothetical protein [Frankiales bacterium]